MHQSIDQRTKEQERADAEAEQKKKRQEEYVRRCAEISPLKISRYLCPECGRLHPDGDSIDGCSMVIGRRGWRRLGEYDG